MPQLIKPGSVKIMTQDGEVQVSIALELNINVNTDGGVRVAAQATAGPSLPGLLGGDDKPEWAIPDFDASPKLEFGKRE